MPATASLRARLLALVPLAVGLTAACTDDAPAQQPRTCKVPPAVITCTVGDDGPCTAVCDDAYCFLYERVGSVCTHSCSGAEDCPEGWSCNNKGRCRPPG